MNFFKYTLEFIFPPICGICGNLGQGYICNKCYELIKKYSYINKNEEIFYLLKYQDIVRDKMIKYKFNDKSYLHFMFYEILLKNKKCCEFINSYDIIIPVPINKQKRKLRGYNQSELIARDISKKFLIEMGVNVLLKNKETLTQSTLNKEDRIKNVQNVYKVEHKEKIQGKRVILLDDIYTTGATVNECKKVLMQAGAKEVGIIIIAKD